MIGHAHAIAYIGIWFGTPSVIVTWRERRCIKLYKYMYMHTYCFQGRVFLSCLETKTFSLRLWITVVLKVGSNHTHRLKLVTLLNILLIKLGQLACFLTSCGWNGETYCDHRFDVLLACDVEAWLWIALHHYVNGHNWVCHFMQPLQNQCWAMGAVSASLGTRPSIIFIN